MAGRRSKRATTAIQRYAADLPQVQAATEAWVALVTQLLDDAGINYLSVTGRAKTVESYAGKAARRERGRLLYPDPEQDITDLVGVRVVTFVQSDVAAVADLMADQLSVLDDRDMGRETAEKGGFGYSSRHLHVALDPAREGEGPMQGRPVALQVRTVLQHAWAEFEHDIRYKGHVPEVHRADLDRRFTLAAGLLELADEQFQEIRDRLREELPGPEESESDDPRIGPQDLAAFLAGQFGDAGWSRTDHYAWISGLLLELGITSLSELREVLRGVDTGVIGARMGYRYPPGAVRRLDDALLQAFGERYVALHGNADRRALLEARLEKLRPAEGADGQAAPERPD